MASLARETVVEMQAYAFRELIKHLQRRTDVPNIDMMNQSGFCRNCLAKWFLAGARVCGLDAATCSLADAQQHIYGMPAREWKETYPHQGCAGTHELVALLV